MSKIIAVSGSHGTGKTTKMNELKNECKNERFGIVEIARKCPYDVIKKDNSTVSYEAQLWILTKQISEELELLTKPYKIFSDRTVIDNLAYTMLGNCHDLGFYNQLEFVKKYIEEINPYEKIYFMSIENNDWLKDDGFRSMDIRLRKDVENNMLYLYKELNLESILEVI